MVGAVRRFRLADGGELREQLLSLSDEKRTLTYCLLEAPLPLMGYVATIRLKPVTDGDAHVLGMALRIPSARASPRGTDGAGARRRLSRRLRGDPQHVRARAGRLRRPQARPAASACRRDAGSGACRRSLRQCLRSHRRRRRGRSSSSAMAGRRCWNSRRSALPAPAPGEVLIRHTAIGVNFIDVYCRTGYFDLLHAARRAGHGGGRHRRGGRPGRSGFSPGDRVAYACPPVGAYAERRVMSPESAGAAARRHFRRDGRRRPAQGRHAPASCCTTCIRCAPGQIVLVHAAAGGVGQLLVQWARHLGATVIATVSSDDKARIARAARRRSRHRLLAREFRRRGDAHHRRAAAPTSIYDAVGADTFAGSLEALAMRGHLVSFGQASGPVGNWDIGRFASKSVTMSRPNYGHYTDTREKLRRMSSASLPR